MFYQRPSYNKRPSSCRKKRCESRLYFYIAFVWADLFKTSLSILDLSGDLLEMWVHTLIDPSLKLTVTHSLTPIIICRFTLDLRQVSFPRGASLSSKQSVSLRFVGNAGGSLRFGADEGEEDEENTVDFPRAE